MELQGKAFFITGGASGLGAACIRRFVSAGAQVIAVDMNEEIGKSLKDELGKSIQFAKADVTNEDQIRNAIKLCVDSFNGLHGVINCAGLAPPEKVLSKEGVPQKLENFSKIIHVNLIGTFNVIRLCAAHMITQEPFASGERGVIINTASVAAYEGQIGQAAYSASKGGVLAMALPIARELARYGIRVNTIAPGIFDTPMLASLPEAARASLGAQVPFPPRLGKPDEYAALAQHIVENEMINAEVIRLDGAIRMAAK